MTIATNKSTFQVGARRTTLEHSMLPPFGDMAVSERISHSEAARRMETPALVRPAPDAGGRTANQLPDTSVHPVAIAIPLACAAWFVIVNWVAFGGGEASLVLAIVTLICAMLLGLMVLCAAMSRDMTPERARHRSLRAFLNGPVDIATGTLSGRQALIQIASMPVALALAFTAIALIATHT